MSMETMPEQFLQSFAPGVFPPAVLEAGQRARARFEALRQQWEVEPDSELTFGDEETITMYNCYPYLFLEAFPPIAAEKVDDFALASNLFANAAFMTDKVIDLSQKAHRAARFMLLIVAFQTEGWALLNQLFPASSAFWQRFRGYLFDYFRACMHEKKFVRGELPWKDFDENLAWKLVIAKCGISQAAVAGLAGLSGDEAPLEALTKSICLYNFAHQMLDDLCDWKEDYLGQSPSLLLCSLLKERPENPRQEDLKEIARKIYYEGYASKVLHLAIDALNQSIALISVELPWYHLQIKLRERCLGLLNDIMKITEMNRRRAVQQPNFHLELPLAGTPDQQPIWQGLQYLVQQWQKGFVEARQVTHFPHAEGFTGRSELQYADIFQRAILAEILLDVSHTFALDLRTIIDYELNYLVESRCRDGIGGWSYFPNLPELAPDADDLAQIMQVCWLSGRFEAIKDYCEQPLHTLLSENRSSDGSFETWIIPAHNRTAKQDRQAFYAEHGWKRTADVDVMANLLYALALYDEQRFADVINAGVQYIESRQDADGSWYSTWYYGPFYATYVTLRLLEQVRPTSHTLEVARHFLLNSQHEDGSWGMPGGQGDPLSTALALLCWSYLARLGKLGDAAPAIGKALAYLRHSYDEKEQSWPRYEFIRMTKKEEVGDRTYGSRTITTAYVVKAATAWHRLYDCLGATEAPEAVPGRS